jgi:zinc protease
MTSRKANILASLAIASVLVCACRPAPRTTLPQLPIDQFVLANGLTVVLQPSKTSPLVAVVVDYRVGAADQPDGQAGFAHLFEHLILSGSQHVDHDLQQTIFEEHGGDDNARTDYDYTELVSVGPSNDLETMFWIQSDRMGFLLPRPDALHSLDLQKDVVANERHQRIDSNPASLALETLVGKLFPIGHPYHDLVIGPADQLASITLPSAESFYATYYRPARAVLVVTGDFEPRQARRLIERYFGTLENPAAPPPTARNPRIVPRTTPARIEIRANVAHTELMVGWSTPPAFARDEWAVRMAATILGEGESALLNHRLVAALGLATSADCTHRPLQLASIFICQIDVKDGVDPSEVEREFFNVLTELRSTGPSPMDLQRSTTVWKAALIRRLEGIRQRALQLGWYALLTGNAEFFGVDAARIAKVSGHDVQMAIQSYLRADQSVVVLLMPEAANEAH